MTKFEEKRQNRIGEQHGTLTIVGWQLNSQLHLYRAVCKCSCCNENKIVDYTKLKRGEIFGCGKNRGRKDRGGSALMRVYAKYRSNARRRKISFDLSIVQFKALIFQNCNYCQYPPSLIEQSWKQNTTDVIRYNGIDRRDSKNSYNIDNCVSCCEFCNRAKNDRSEEEFLKWLNFIKQ